MLIRVKQIFVGALCALALLLGVIAHGAFATTYGSGAYGNCTYNCANSNNTPQTSVTLPSGLQVTINLTNGQKIPPTGYVVIVQPASGQTGSLQKVDFYVNGVLQFTGTPNPAGAVRWLWQPSQSSGDVTVKVVITDNNNITSTQEFTVTIAAPETPTQTTSEPSNPFSSFANLVLNFVGTLPAPVLYGLPYFLFGLLLINIILLLTQTQREIREVATLQRIIELERRTGLEKNAFVSLASHYLRTPISIMEGGLGLLQQQSAITAEVGAQIQQLIASLRTKVNTLLARSDEAGQAGELVTTQQTTPSAWKNPGLYVPILLIGLFVVLFNYITAHVQSFSVNQLNFVVQAVAFALLVIVFYQVFRRRQLRRRDTQGMQQALAREQAINQTRDQLIAESTTLLGGDIEGLRTIASSLPASQATQFMQDGIGRFHSVLLKFAIASQLRAGQSLGPAEATSLQALLSGLPQSLKDKATAKNVQTNLAEDSQFTTHNPQLLSYVLASLIDNAIEYSAAGQAVDLRAVHRATDTIVTVTDRGPGITSEKMSLLFRPFSQTQDVERFTHEGMGFSLYLDRLIMTYLGGTIAIASRPGVETTATITLPA